MTEKNLKTLDAEQLKQYITDKSNLTAELKDKALFLANVYGNNIKIEIDVNPTVQSVKFSVREYL